MQTKNKESKMIIQCLINANLHSTNIFWGLVYIRWCTSELFIQVIDIENVATDRFNFYFKVASFTDPLYETAYNTTTQHCVNGIFWLLINLLIIFCLWKWICSRFLSATAALSKCISGCILHSVINPKMVPHASLNSISFKRLKKLCLIILLETLTPIVLLNL